MPTPCLRFQLTRPIRLCVWFLRKSVFHNKAFYYFVRFCLPQDYRRRTLYRALKLVSSRHFSLHPLSRGLKFTAHLLCCIATRTLRNFDLPDSIQTNRCVISLRSPPPLWVTRPFSLPSSRWALSLRGIMFCLRNPSRASFAAPGRERQYAPITVLKQHAASVSPCPCRPRCLYSTRHYSHGIPWTCAPQFYTNVSGNLSRLGMKETIWDESSSKTNVFCLTVKWQKKVASWLLTQ